MKKILVLIFGVVLFCFACVKVTELASGAKVEEFVIKLESVSEGVELAAQNVTIESISTENTIYINVLRGQYVSPIEFNAFISASIISVGILPSDGIVSVDDPKDENGAETIMTKKGTNLPFMRIDDDGYENAGTFSIRFASADEIVTFWVIDENGMPHKWDIKLKFSERSDDAFITKFEVIDLVPGLVISQNPFIQEANAKIDVYVTRGTFPISFNSIIEVSEGADVEIVSKKTKMVSELIFKSYADTSIVKVIAHSGFAKEWKVALREAKVLTDITSVDADQLSRMTLTKENLTVTAEGDETPLEINVFNDSRKIELYLTDEQLANSAEITLNIASSPSVQVLGSTKIKFDSEGKSTYYLYMVDESSDYYLRWSVSVAIDEPDLVRVDGATFETYTANDVVVNKVSHVDVDAKEVWFNVNEELATYNITLNGVKCLTNRKATNTLPETLIFTALNTPHPFSVTSEDKSETEQWNMIIRYKPTSSDAQLLDFDLKQTSVDWTKTHIEQTKKKITIEVNQMDKLNFTPSFRLSSGATVRSEDGEIGNNIPSSISINTPVKLIITAEDQVTVNEWTIEFIYAPQLDDREFNSTSFSKTTDSWASANVTSPVVLEGTVSVYRDAENGTAVMASTKKQDASVMGFMVAAGACFKGEFEMLFNATAMSFPRTMTKFGIKFTPIAKPLSYSIDVKYVQGSKMQQAVKVAGKYVIEDRPGNDKGQIWMEMINYTDNGGDMRRVENAYSGDGKNGIGEVAPGVTVVSRANFEIDGTDSKFNNWVNRHEVPLVAQDESKTITHVAFVISSSIAGDKYLGAIGSNMWADNIVINYYMPESGAIIKYRK